MWNVLSNVDSYLFSEIINKLKHYASSVIVVLNVCVGNIIITIMFDIVLTDPEVTVDVPDISVPENETVEVCISVNTGFAQQVIVTTETGLKAGSSNPATGMEALKL